MVICFTYNLVRLKLVKKKGDAHLAIFIRLLHLHAVCYVLIPGILKLNFKIIQFLTEKYWRISNKTIQKTVWRHGAD